MLKNKKLENKSVGVLFSGGLDSTYLIWKNLTEGNDVYPIYFEIENNDRKVRLEKNRIELLYKKFSEEFGSKIHKINYTLKISVENTRYSGLQLHQLPIWVIGLQWLQNLDVSEFQFGYIMNDDAISYIDDIKNIHNSFSGLQDNVKTLNFPLIKEKKILIAQALPTKYFDLIVSCESPNIINDESEIFEYQPCCVCPACKRLISEYYDLISDKTIYEDSLKYKRLYDVEQYSKDGIIDLNKIFNISLNEPVKGKKVMKQLEFDFPE
jgi:hypothetical protein